MEMAKRLTKSSIAMALLLVESSLETKIEIAPSETKSNAMAIKNLKLSKNQQKVKDF